MSEQARRIARQIWEPICAAGMGPVTTSYDEGAIDIIAAALDAAERRGVEKMIAALVASPYSERIRYTRAEDWYEAVASRLLSEKEEAPPSRRAPSPLVEACRPLLDSANITGAAEYVVISLTPEEWRTLRAALERSKR